MPARLLTVAIVGRPNVGKSTLFNRLAGRRLAIVDDMPGVTRDRREGEANFGDLALRVIDTAGFEDARGDDLTARIQAQTARAIAAADVTLLLIDARAGVTPIDRVFASDLRRGGKPVILIANKCEGRAGEPGRLEAFALGLGEPVALSAEHGEGLDQLYDALRPFATADAGAPTDDAVDDGADGETAETDPAFAGVIEDGATLATGAPLQLAVIGRPNVGKSTLINRLIGEDRMITGPEAGITRDAISISWSYRDQPIRLIDTAGLRRRANVASRLEGLAGADTLRAVRFAQVVVLTLDATQGLEKQDLTIARTVVEEGRALVLAVNKWDLVTDRARVLTGIEERLEKSLPQVRGLRIVTFSALTSAGVDRLLPAVLDSYAAWNIIIPTPRLNRWLAMMTERNRPPQVLGRQLKIRYMTQLKARPPTFLIFTNRPGELPESYLRYLANGLRDDFGLAGVPLRFSNRRTKNPYAD